MGGHFTQEPRAFLERVRRFQFSVAPNVSKLEASSAGSQSGTNRHMEKRDFGSV